MRLLIICAAAILAPIFIENVVFVPERAEVVVRSPEDEPEYPKLSKHFEVARRQLMEYGWNPAPDRFGSFDAARAGLSTDGFEHWYRMGVKEIQHCDGFRCNFEYRRDKWVMVVKVDKTIVENILLSKD